MAFVGKEYKLVSQDNFDGFIDSLGAEIPENFKAALVSYKPTSKIVKNGDQYTMTNSKPDGTASELTFKSGVEFPDNVYGHSAKTTITVDGNVVNQVQHFDDGGVFTFKREFKGDDLTVTITSNKWDGVAKRFYKA